MRRCFICGRNGNGDRLERQAEVERICGGDDNDVH